jgi:hypothetical protein
VLCEWERSPPRPEGVTLLRLGIGEAGQPLRVGVRLGTLNHSKLWMPCSQSGGNCRGGIYQFA